MMPLHRLGGICASCRLMNHWHDTPDGTCQDPRCECEYRPQQRNT